MRVNFFQILTTVLPDGLASSQRVDDEDSDRHRRPLDPTGLRCAWTDSRHSHTDCFWYHHYMVKLGDWTLQEQAPRSILHRRRGQAHVGHLGPMDLLCGFPAVYATYPIKYSHQPICMPLTCARLHLRQRLSLHICCNGFQCLYGARYVHYRTCLCCVRTGLLPGLNTNALESQRARLDWNGQYHHLELATHQSLLYELLH